MTPRYVIVISVFLLMLRVLAQAASAQSMRSEVVGTYLNEGRSLVEIEMISKDGKEGTNIPLSAGRIDRAVITEGRTIVYAPAEGKAKRRLLSSIPTPTPKTASDFFEKSTRTFYFRIVAGKISLVKPQDLTAAERSHVSAAIRELKRAGVYNN